MDLFINLYEHNISELGYEAEVAQLEYSTDTFRRGMTLTMNGLNHKLPLLFRGLIDHLATFSTTHENFEMIKVYSSNENLMFVTNVFLLSSSNFLLFEYLKEQLQKKYSNSTLKPKRLCKLVM